MKLIACLQTVKDKVQVCKLWDYQTIGIHSHEVQAKLNKIPKFGVHRPKVLARYSHLKMSKFAKKCMAIQMPSDTVSGCHAFLC